MYKEQDCLKKRKFLDRKAATASTSASIAAVSDPCKQTTRMTYTPLPVMSITTMPVMSQPAPAHTSIDTTHTQSYSSATDYG